MMRNSRTSFQKNTICTKYENEKFKLVDHFENFLNFGSPILDFIILKIFAEK